MRFDDAGDSDDRGRLADLYARNPRRAALLVSEPPMFSGAPELVGDEQPLLIHIDARGPLLVWARVVRRAVPIELRYAAGTVTGASAPAPPSNTT